MSLKIEPWGEEEDRRAWFSRPVCFWEGTVPSPPRHIYPVCPIIWIRIRKSSYSVGILTISKPPPQDSPVRKGGGKADLKTGQRSQEGNRWDAVTKEQAQVARCLDWALPWDPQVSVALRAPGSFTEDFSELQRSVTHESVGTSASAKHARATLGEGAFPLHTERPCELVLPGRTRGKCKAPGSRPVLSLPSQWPLEHAFPAQPQPFSSIKWWRSTIRLCDSTST